MPSPQRKRLIDPLVTGMRDQPCRLQRRKLANRRMTSIRTGALLTSNSVTDHFADRHGQRASFSWVQETFNEETYGLEVVLHAIVEPFAQRSGAG